jgi:hypothetical protein
MLTKPQLARFVQSAGLDDRGYAEREVVLTYLLRLLAERGFIERIVFKGGTYIRKMLLATAAASPPTSTSPRAPRSPTRTGEILASPRCSQSHATRSSSGSTSATRRNGESKADTLDGHCDSSWAVVPNYLRRQLRHPCSILRRKARTPPSSLMGDRCTASIARNAMA